jgi:hypothetical protein
MFRSLGIMRLLKNRHNWHGNIEVRVCPSGKSVDPKFLSSNDVLARSRIVEEYASIRELISALPLVAASHGAQ